MFDDPKKELERLEQQLLAAETYEEADEPDDEQFDRLYDEIYDEFGREDPYEMDEELRSMLSRSAGYEAEEAGELDEDRYVTAPKKEKGLGGLLIFVILEAICVIALAAWWLVRTLT